MTAALHPPNPEAVFRQFCDANSVNSLHMFTGSLTPGFENPLVGMISPFLKE